MDFLVKINVLSQSNIWHTKPEGLDLWIAVGAAHGFLCPNLTTPKGLTLAVLIRQCVHSQPILGCIFCELLTPGFARGYRQVKPFGLGKPHLYEILLTTVKVADSHKNL